MENINITNAEFSSTMPKWATDETLQRLMQFLNRQSNKNNREQDKLLKVIGNIYNSGRKSETIDRNIIQELKTINKNLVDGSKGGDRNSNNGSVKLHNKKVEDLLLKTQVIIKSIENKMPVGNAGDNGKGGGKGKGNNGPNNSGDIRVIERSIISSNKSVISAINRLGGKTKEASGSPFDRIDDILNRRNSDLRNKSGATGRAADAFRGNNGGDVAGASGGIVKTLGRITGSLVQFAKFLPIIGGIVTALSSVATILSVVASKTKEFAWDSQLEYKAMLKSGFSFGIESIEKGIKMDGIKLQQMINRSGMTIEKGIALMERNAVLVNNLGVSGIYDTIRDVANLQDESGVSFQDRMNLSIDEIGGFTTQYLASSMNIIRTEQMSSDNRNKAAKTFIEDARKFGQVTGQGMQEIIDKMTELRKTADYKLAELTRGSGNAVMEKALTMFQAMNMPSNITTMFTDAIMDSRGLGLAAAGSGANEMLNALGTVVGIDKQVDLDNLIRDVQTNQVSPEEFESRLSSILDGFEVDNLNINEMNARVLKDGGSQAAKDMAHLITALQNSRKEGLDKKLVAQRDSELVKQQQATQTRMDATKAAIEKLAIDAADSDPARSGMISGLGFMETAAAATTSLLSNILDVLKWIGEIIIEGLNKLPGVNILDKAGKQRETFYKDAEKSKIGEGNIQKIISDATGIAIKTNRQGDSSLDIGVFAKGDSNRKMQAHAQKLYDSAMAGNADDAETLRHLVSSSNEDISKNYKKILDTQLKAKDADQALILSAIRGNSESTQSVTKEVVTKELPPKNTKDNRTPSKVVQPLPDELQNTTKSVPITQTVEVLHNTDAMVDNKSDVSEYDRQDRQDRQLGHDRTSNTPETIPDNTSQQHNTTTTSYNNGQIPNVVDFSSVNTKLDELIKIFKEFNRNMTVKIIKA